MQEQAPLMAGMIMMHAGINRVNHTCKRDEGETYIFAGAELPSCPDCHVIYVFTNESDATPPTQAAAS